VLGVPVPAPSGIDRRYHEGLIKHRLVIQQCAGCDAWQWPPEVLCHQCRSFDMRWVEVAPVGTLFTWTRVWHAAREGLEDAVPYVVAVVELEAAPGVRLVCNLLGDPTRVPVSGERLCGEFEDHATGTDRYTLLHWRRDPT
jgi:uncharacterized OB-fold protein